MLTFGAGYICDAFWFRETCRDPPFTAERPFLAEADAENEHGGASFVTVEEAHVGIPRGGPTHTQPNMCLHQGASRLLESRLSSSVHELSEDDFFFFFSVQKKTSKARWF